MSRAGFAPQAAGMTSHTIIAPDNPIASPSNLSATTRLPAWLDRDSYPFLPRSFKTSAGTQSYVDEGPNAERSKEGPLLFVHGTPSWSFEWRHAIQHFSKTRRCVAPDHLGFGLSEKPADAGYRPVDHARRLQALVQALDLQNVTLVVHDFGGPIGLPLALFEPSRVRELVVVNSWMWSLQDDAKVRRLSALIRSPLGRFLYLWLNASPRWLIPASFGDRRKLSKSTHQHYLLPFQSRAERIAPWTLGCELSASSDYYAKLWEQRHILSSKPLKLIWGSQDPAFGSETLERWRRAFPHAQVIELPGVGHFPQEEAADAFIQSLS